MTITRDCQTILVTGASSGFGQAIATTLAARGHSVFGTSRRPAGATPVLAGMLPLDVTDDASAAACVAQAAASGRIDVLINNAGIGVAGAVEDMTLAEAHQQMETNFFGAARMIHAVLPLMRAQGSGRIITIGSLAGHAALPFQAYYSASKFALEGLNEALRLELRGTGIDHTIVCPGDFRTGFTAARLVAEAAGRGLNAERFARTLQIYERDETKGADPRLVADLVAKLVATPKLAPRYLVGKASQIWAIRLKRVLPAAWFESLMASTYKV